MVSRSEKSQININDSTGIDAVGEVSGSPTANTLLARLKDIVDTIAGGITATISGIVQAGTASDVIAQTPTISAASIYASGDCVGGELEFADAALASGDGGIIKGVEIIDDDGEEAELELWLFDRTIGTPGSDNAAWAADEGDLENEVTVISTAEGTYYSGGTASVCSIECARGFKCNGTSLFGRLVVRGTPTYTATDDITVKLVVMQDQ